MLASDRTGWRVTPSKYTGLAKRTEMGPEKYTGALGRLAETHSLSAPLLRLTFAAMRRFVWASHELDRVKAAVFYGKAVAWTEEEITGASIHGVHAPSPRALTRALDLLPGRGMRLLHGIAGFATEAGELVEQLVGHLAEGKPLDETNLVEEAGDAFYFFAVMLDALGVPWETVMERNIAKLQKRYPAKFTTEGALERDLAGERAALEGVKRLTWETNGHVIDFGEAIPSAVALLAACRARQADRTEANDDAMQDAWNVWKADLRERAQAGMPMAPTTDPNVCDAVSTLTMKEPVRFGEPPERFKLLREPLSLKSAQTLRNAMNAVWLANDPLLREAIAQRDADATGRLTPPARYNRDERETCDKMRDLVSDREFVAACAINVLKYSDRKGAKGPAAVDEEKAAWWRAMALHVQSGGLEPDPRAHRPTYVPYVRQPYPMGLHGLGKMDPETSLLVIHRPDADEMIDFTDGRRDV